MRVQEVMLQAMAKITWWQAAETLGVSARTMRRWKWQYDQHGFRGIRDLGISIAAPAEASEQYEAAIKTLER